MNAPDFNILIVEDELLIAEMLMEMLCELGYKVPAIAKNYEEAISALSTNKTIDLAFIDINLEDPKNGFDVVQTINGQYKVPFIFLTSYSDRDTIQRAIAFKPESYLVKPFSQTDLLTTVEIIRTRKHNLVKAGDEPKTVLLKDGNLTVKLSTSEIRWIKTDNIYVEIKTPGKTYLVRTSMEKFLDELNAPTFFRTHRSYAVNINYVNAVNGQYLIIDSEKIPISRKFRNEIHQRFNTRV